jgi:hypothetical protein
LPGELLEGLEASEWDKNYRHELVLLMKEEVMLQDMIDRLIEVGRCYDGMEMNVDKTKVMQMSEQPFLLQIMRDQ